jgi:hypothetical protein
VTKVLGPIVSYFVLQLAVHTCEKAKIIKQQKLDELCGREEDNNKYLTSFMTGR